MLVGFIPRENVQGASPCLAQLYMKPERMLAYIDLYTEAIDDDIDAFCEYLLTPTKKNRKKAEETLRFVADLAKDALGVEDHKMKGIA